MNEASGLKAMLVDMLCALESEVKTLNPDKHNRLVRELGVLLAETVIDDTILGYHGPEIPCDPIEQLGVNVGGKQVASLLSIEPGSPQAMVVEDMAYLLLNVNGTVSGGSLIELYIYPDKKSYVIHVHDGNDRPEHMVARMITALDELGYQGEVYEDHTG